MIWSERRQGVGNFPLQGSHEKEKVYHRKKIDSSDSRSVSLLYGKPCSTTCAAAEFEDSRIQGLMFVNRSRT